MSEDNGDNVCWADKVIPKREDLVTEAQQYREALDDRLDALDDVIKAMDDSISLIVSRRDTLGEAFKALVERVQAIENTDALVKGVTEFKGALEKRFAALEDTVETLAPFAAATAKLVAEVAEKQAAPDKLKERFYFLKTEIDITQAAIDQLQTKVSMPNNFKLTSRDVSELVKMVDAGIAHITTCKRELDSTKGQLAERYVEQWRKKQAEIAEHAVTGK